MTQEQQESAERLQATQPKEDDQWDRFRFMRAIVSVPREELETAPEPPKEKRGRKPAPKTLPA